MQFFVPSPDSRFFNGLLTYELFPPRCPPALYETASVFFSLSLFVPSSRKKTRTKVYRFMRKSVALASRATILRHHLARCSNRSEEAMAIVSRLFPSFFFHLVHDDTRYTTNYPIRHFIRHFILNFNTSRGLLSLDDIYFL